MVIDGHEILVASLDDIVKSKRAAGRPRDHAVMAVLEQTLDEKKKRAKTEGA